MLYSNRNIMHNVVYKYDTFWLPHYSFLLFLQFYPEWSWMQRTDDRQESTRCPLRFWICALPASISIRSLITFGSVCILRMHSQTWPISLFAESQWKEQALHTNPVLSCSIPHPGVLRIILSRHIFMHPGRTSSQVIFHAHSYQFFCFTDISTLHVATEHIPTCNVFTISEQRHMATANVPHPLRRLHDSAI